MRAKALMTTIGVMAVLLLFIPASNASTLYIYGYVKYNNGYVNGATVSLSNGYSGSDTTRNNGTDGYYQFTIQNGSDRDYVITASYNGSFVDGGFHVSYATSDVSVCKNLTIPLTAPTSTPTPTPRPPTATPTPRPSGDIGGTVTHEDSSSFMPAYANGHTPTPAMNPSRAPSPSPTAKPTPTPARDEGIISLIQENIYVVIAALGAIAVILAAILLYLRRY